MKASVEKWLRESVDPDLCGDAINDAIESLWESLILVQLSLFMEGPVNVTFAAAAERAQIVVITDPLVAPVAGILAGGSLAAGRTYSITYTLVTESGSETLESPALAYTVVGANNLCEVNTPAFVDGAIGWNCYASQSAALRCRQNDMPIPFSQLIYVEPETGWVNEPSLPSPPLANTTSDNVFYIRHMELALASGGYRAWDQADIDSELLRRASRGVASSSQYQNYYWDLINGRTIELRPAAGVQQIPRYFYIAKPRRLRYDNAAIPFQTLTAKRFIRYFALSLLCVSIYEFDQARGWEDQAEKARTQMLLSVNQQNQAKHRTITPYIV
jgi:hypothetical protein